MSASVAMASTRAVQDAWQQLRERVATASPLRTSAWATLLTVVPFSPGYALVPVLLVAAAGFSWPQLTHRAWFWFALAGLRLVALVPFDWPTLDNHHYLLTYWLLALGFAHLGPDPARTAALAGRLLIGFAFAAATIWKLLTPDFASGEFFRFLLATDGLPAPIGSWLPGSDGALMEANREAAGPVLVEGETTTLDESPLAPALGWLLAWWTVLIEAVVAFAFLVPLSLRWAGVRPVLLLVFIVTTYPIAPVIGFGWTLVAMAFAMVRPGDQRTLLALGAGALLILAAAALHLGGATLALVGVLLLLGYMRTSQRAWMSAGAPVAGLGSGLVVGEPWHAAAGIAVGLGVEALFAALRRRDWRPSALVAVLAAASAAAAWDSPSLAPLAWAGVAAGAAAAVWCGLLTPSRALHGEATH